MGEKLLEAVQYVLDFGPTVMLPIVAFILALCFRVKFTKALRSSLTIGIGFVGIYAIFNILTGNVGPAAQAMVENAGIDLPVVDLGWPPLAAITWASPIAPFVIPLTILITIGLLAINKTKTVDIDLWNYWHFALAGTLVYYATGSFLLGLVGAGIACIIILKLADWSAPMVQKHLNLQGISLPTLSSVIFFPIGLLADKIIDKVPFINKINISPEKIQKRFGVFGEPMMVGIILGILLGIIARYEFKDILTLGINIGAVMFILPRMVRILMEGLLPISDAVKKFLNNKYPGRKDLYIGLDIAVAVGNPAIISSALVLTPIAVILAFILPGNKTLPLGDLANIAVMISMVVLATRGNVFRSVLIGIPIIIGDLLVASALAPRITNLAKDVNFSFPEGASGLVSSFLDGGNPFRYWLMKISELNLFALLLVPIIAGILYWLYKTTKDKVYHS
ncbi:PTS galactitol transporter subunit IIC [Niallia sp. Marseille-Q9988]